MYSIPQVLSINRGKLSLDGISEKALEVNADRVIVVDRWRNGAHMQRWVAAGLLEVEPRLNKVNGSQYLNPLRERIKEELKRLAKEKQLSVEEELVEVRV